MEESIKFIRIPLVVTGFDIFTDSNKFMIIILRFVTYFSLTFPLLCLSYAVAFDKQLEFSDQIFISTGQQGFIIGIIQLSYFWYHRENVSGLFDDVKKLHGVRDEELVEQLSQPLFAECSIFLRKLCKYEF